MAFDVPDGFRIIPASDYCRAVTDGTHDSPKEVPQGRLLITSKNIKGGRIEKSTAYTISVADYEQIVRRSRVERWDIIFTMIGTVGELALVNELAPDFAIKNVGLFKTRNELSAKWLYYFMSSPIAKDELERRKKGSTQQYISLGDLRTFPILASENHAHKVATVDLLSRLDARIDLLRQTNTTLESIAQALFKSWFIDFDPVHAKAEGREPEGMDAATAALFPAEFEESALGLIPKGWRVGCVADVADVIDCLHSKKPELLPAGKPFLQLNNIRDDGLLDASAIACISDPDYTKWTSRIEAREGDCVITNVGRVGAVSQVPPGMKAAMGRNMTAIRLRPEAPYPTFLIELLLSRWMREEIGRRTDVGTILDALNVRSIPRLQFVLPPDSILLAAESLLRPLRASMESNLYRATHLAKVRDTLLPRLISGKLRISDIEAQTEEAIA